MIMDNKPPTFGPSAVIDQAAYEPRSGKSALMNELIAEFAGKPMTMPRNLSEPQQCLVNKLRSGAVLRHFTATGLFRLKDGPIERTIHPATVQSLVSSGVLCKSLGGECRLTK